MSVLSSWNISTWPDGCIIMEMHTIRYYRNFDSSTSAYRK